MTLGIDRHVEGSFAQCIVQSSGGMIETGINPFLTCESSDLFFGFFLHLRFSLQCQFHLGKFRVLLHLPLKIFRSFYFLSQPFVLFRASETLSDLLTLVAGEMVEVGV